MKAVEKEEKAPKAAFSSIILLEDASLDFSILQQNLLKDWNIECPNPKEGETSVIFPIMEEEVLVYIYLVPNPLPKIASEFFGARSGLWLESKQVISSHQAYIMASVFTNNAPTLDEGLVAVKLAHSCFKLPNATAVCVSSFFDDPESFQKDIWLWKKFNIKPCRLLVYVGFAISPTGNGYCVVTDGMEKMGLRNFEILDSEARPTDLIRKARLFASIMAENNYNPEPGFVFNHEDGDIVCVEELSDGVLVEGKTCKIEYKKIRNPFLN